MSELLLSPKYRAFLRCRAPVEFLEGTTAAGKTTVGLLKFMLLVAESEKPIHILSGLDLGTIEKNIIAKELGILQDFGALARYYPRAHGGIGLPHIEFDTPHGQKIIFVLGYDNRARWKKALGGQYGCLYIDEINIADMDYVREAALRCDTLLATLNPDDPDLPVYAEFINHSRPLPLWAADTPPAILAALETAPAKPGWVHWFFTFSDNAGLPAQKLCSILQNVPPGTKVWQNKVMGLRGRSTGRVFRVAPANVLTPAQARKLRFVRFSCGVDTAFSRRTPDTLCFVFVGLTARGQLAVLEEYVVNNKARRTPVTPSDVPPMLAAFLDLCRARWGFAPAAFIDCADAGTLAECEKFRICHGCLYDFAPSWKRLSVLSRIELQQGWMAHGVYLTGDWCAEHLHELNSYSWQDDRTRPEDGHDHTINAAQYAWMPLLAQIGRPPSAAPPACPL